MSGRKINKPKIIIPHRKNLPIIGTLTKDVITIDSNHVALKNEIEERADARRNNQEISGECDKFYNLQSLITPELKVGLRIDMIFNYCDNEQDNDVKMRSQGEIKIISNVTKLPKESSGFPTKAYCLVSWDVSFSSVVSLPSRLCNKQEVNSLKVDIGSF